MSEQNQNSNHGQHCPFLNRAETRCARHFSLDQLQHTFDHCFGQYEACGVYLELLYERRVRRAAARLEREVILANGQAARERPDVFTDPDQADHLPPRRPAGNPLVQLTISGRAAVGRGIQARPADPALVSHAPGL